MRAIETFKMKHLKFKRVCGTKLYHWGEHDMIYDEDGKKVPFEITFASADDFEFVCAHSKVIEYGLIDRSVNVSGLGRYLLGGVEYACANCGEAMEPAEPIRFKQKYKIADVKVVHQIMG